MAEKSKPGRPTGTAGNKQEVILKSATHLFFELGYEKTTIRLIAQHAEVDPKLVMHYFGNKQKLFIATVNAPEEAQVALKLLKLSPKALWGKNITNAIWLAQKSGSMKTLIGVIRAAASEPEAAEMFKEFYMENLMMPMVENLPVDHKETRAVMISSLMAGYAFNLEITHIFDSPGVSEKHTKKLFAQMIQTILTAKL